jgi:CheY-like chemotaxis protein
MSATILIVEDEFAVARGIQYALQQEGYEVAVARSGEEGLEFATNQAPDLVVLDVRLPGMDGRQLIEKLKSRPATANFSSVLMASKADIAERLSQHEGELHLGIAVEQSSKGEQDSVHRHPDRRVLRWVKGNDFGGS